MCEWNTMCFYYVSWFGDTMLQLFPLGSTIQHALTSTFGSLWISCCWPACSNKCWSPAATSLLYNEWSEQIFQSLSKEGVIPKEGLLLLQQSNGCGYTFLRNAYVQFHPYVMQHAVSLTSTHPHQVPSISFNDYFMKADFHYNMLGLIENVRVSLGDTYYQDHFITHLQNATAIEEQVCWEQKSHDPQDCYKYSNGMFIQHLSNIAHSLHWISSKSAQSFATNKLHLMESTLHVLDGNKLYNYCIYGIDFNDCEPSKCQHFEQAIYNMMFLQISASLILPNHVHYVAIQVIHLTIVQKLQILIWKSITFVPD